MLLDTNIVIELFKGDERVRDFLLQQDQLCLSAVSVMELFFGALNKRELAVIKKALDAFVIHHVDAAVSQTALKLVETYAKSHSLMIPDALIAATAIHQELPLLTRNQKDFRFITSLTVQTI